MLGYLNADVGHVVFYSVYQKGSSIRFSDTHTCMRLRSTAVIFLKRRCYKCIDDITFGWLIAFLLFVLVTELARIQLVQLSCHARLQ